MMKLKKSMLATVVAFGLLACSCSKESTGPDTSNTSGANLNKVAGIYPAPPSGWTGTTNPYNTTGWVGDIMPYYDNGKFHLFFLHDAQTKPAGQGFHAIHKFESTNLLDFSYGGEMIPYGSTTQPDFAIGTGSTVKVGDTYYMYYTGHNGISEFLMSNPRESVLYATSKDLKTWIKNTTFKLTAPPEYYNFDFRDPHVFFNSEKNEYWMLISTQTVHSRKAVVLLYTSANPATNNWTLKGPLYTTTEEERYLMMECADVFKMGNFWYMFFSENWSSNKGTHYRIADSSEGPWRKPAHDMLDGEFFYAAKTETDGAKRYLFGWTARRLPENDNGNKEWAGNMVAHELTQAADGTLGVKVPGTVAAIFKNNLPLQVQKSAGAVTVNANTYQLNGSGAEAFYTFTPVNGTRKIQAKLKADNNTGTTGFIFNANNYPEQGYKIVFEPQRGRVAAYNLTGGNPVEVTRVPFEFKANTEYTIDIVLDGTICVVYIDGKAALSNRIYGMPGRQWGIFGHATQAEFSSLQISSPD
ncbi:glycoside hydrolase family 32 protein [Botryobacter ruber]|uniref:glycoside hydrolase family 32 protein n=1 Tax=Botryobacter ruber TaxID=2171629 RepID=UPI000E0AEC3B|nr:glycoside hydrolase family 32 protein [Botryobacter ruber]